MPRRKKAEPAASATTATTVWREDWCQDFLDVLREVGHVGQAAEAAHVHRATAYRERERNPEFAQAWDDVEEHALDEIEVAGRKAAVQGDSKLIQFFLTTRRREKYAKDDTTELREQLARQEREMEVMRAGFQALSDQDKQTVLKGAREAQKLLDAGGDA